MAVFQTSTLQLQIATLAAVIGIAVFSFLNVRNLI